MNKKLGFGVIGAGILGKMHARVYNELPNTHLVSVADINKNKAEELASEYPGVKWYKDYKEMLKDPELIGVSVSTPDFLHREPVIDSLKAGKHVLVEKPMATTMEDAEAILEASRKAKAYLMVNYSNRWAEVYAKAYETIKNGDIGTALLAYVRKNDTILAPTKVLSWAGKTSCAHFLSTHDVDMIRWFFGEPEAKEVFAVAINGVLRSRGIETQDAIQAIVQFEGGKIATFESAWIYPDTYPTPCESRLEVIGDNGVIHIERNSETIEVCSKETYQYPGTTMGGVVDNQLRGCLRRAMEHFVGSIINGKKPVTDVENGYKVAEIICAIHASIKSGKSVQLSHRE